MFRRRLAWLPLLTLLAMLGPVLAGLGGTLAPAFGYFPAVGATELSAAPLRALFEWPGLPAAARLSVTTGFLATGLSLGIVALLTAGWLGTRAFGLIERALSPLLSVPHAAAALGLAFLIAPSGWIARALSPGLTGWARPPDWLIVQDPLGLTLVAGLIIKEVPFLLLMTIVALGQVRAADRMAVARSLGYGRVAGFFKGVFPQVYAQIRLPVYVVLAYSMSVVDVAVILGPNTPPTLSVQIVRWMGDPDIGMRLQAAAAATLQLALVLGALGLWRLGERAAARLGERWIAAGGRGRFDRALRGIGLTAAGACALAVGLGLLGLAVWSVAGFWAFPEVLPDQFTTRTWMAQAPALADSTAATLAVAGVATLIAVTLSIGCLEAEYRYGLRLTARGLWLLYLPLIVPQIAFLPGLQAWMLSLGAQNGVGPVIAAHVVFVLPYVFLSLGDPFRAWDGRYGVIACAMGAGPDRVLWRVRLPMLLRPVLTASAVGFAVSVGQYLPTLLIGGGRVQTLTTEAVALAAGGDRRVIGLYGLAQTLAALLPFALAIAVPALVWRNRRGLRHG